MKKILSLILFLFSLCVSAQEYRDVIFLKNGSVIKGFYKELYPTDTLRMQTIDGGVFICPMSDVVRIAKEKADMYVVNINTNHEVVKWRPKGYVGTVEWGMSVNLEDTHLSNNSFFTTHGYAFNRNLVLGAGIGIQEIQYTEDSWVSYYKQFNMPLYADAKCYLMHTRCAPFVEVRGGYTVVGFTGLYFNPSIGVVFSFTPHSGAFATIGYTLQKYKYEGVKGNSKNLAFRMGLFF